MADMKSELKADYKTPIDDLVKEKQRAHRLFLQGMKKYKKDQYDYGVSKFKISVTLNPKKEYMVMLNKAKGKLK